jgi:hypothetical protein
MLVTPQQVEKRLMELSAEIDEAQAFLKQAELAYYTAKTECEIKLAKVRLSTKIDGVKLTAQDKADLATVECANLITAVGIAEATVKAARANATRINTQIDIARSVGTSVRAAYNNS